LVAKVEALAAKKGVTPGQLAMAWLLAQAPGIILIPGTKRVAAVEENVGAAAVVLSPEELAEIEAAVPAGAAKGDRCGMIGPGMSPGGGGSEQVPKLYL
jgi:aryl-alcohol dehydrogenase-like predicted oxidoreductase